MGPESKIPACPDRQIISLYHDGELPSPWKEKLETHLETCPECRAALAGYSRLGEALVKLPEDPSEEIIRTAQDRVWRKLSAPELIVPEVYKPKAAQPPRRIWNWKVTLPLPAAAAAAIIIAVMFFAVLGIRKGPQPQLQEPIAAAAGIGLDDRGIVPMQDMNQVIQYLSTQDYGDYMVIRLPETRKFSQSGEPALINAADYSRRIISR